MALSQHWPLLFHQSDGSKGIGIVRINRCTGGEHPWQAIDYLDENL